MKCPPIKELALIVERGDIPRELSGHLMSCEACQEVVATLREETESLGLSLGELWVRERISCPHDDVLLAFVQEDLSAEEAEFVDFHLKTTGCAPCMSVVARIEDSRDRQSPARLDSAMHKSLERSRAFLGGKK